MKNLKRNSRPRLWNEFPLVLGIFVGFYLLWYFGGAGVLDGTFEGYDWPGYTQNAWMISHGHVGASQGLRGLLHPVLMGNLGELLGNYANAGVIISTCSIGAVIVGCGVSVRVFSGAWMGGVTSILVAALVGVAAASRWSNIYSLLAGMSALGIAFSCLSMRYPRLSICILSGLFTGLAYATDLRGQMFLPLALVAPLLSSASLKKKLLLVLVVGSSFMVGPNIRPWLGAPPAVTAEERILVQQPVVSRWIQQSRDPQLETSCRLVNPREFWRVPFLKTDCAQQLLRHNLTHRLLNYFPFGLGLTWYLFFVMLLPGREGLKGTLRTALFLGGAVGPVVLIGAWTPFANRYIMQFILPIACIVPIAIGRAVLSVSPKKILPFSLCGAATALLYFGWINDFSDRTREQGQTTYSSFNRIAAEVSNRLEADDLYLDCSNHFVNIAILPTQTHSGPPLLNADNEGTRCMSWIFNSPANKEGQVWFSTASDKKIRIRQGNDPNDRSLLGPIVEGSELWELVWEDGAFQLWRRI
jgi:MFS family permease